MEALFALFAIILAIAVPLAILLVLCRWIFRIDKIVELLEKIDRNTHPVTIKTNPNPVKKSHPPPKMPCDACKKLFDPRDLTKLDIGKTVCSKCEKFIRSKN